MKLEPTRAGGNQTTGLHDGFGASSGIHAGEGDHDIRILRSQSHHLVVWNLRPSGDPLIDGEDHTADLPRAVIFRYGQRLESGISVAEVFTGCLIGRIARRCGVKMDMSIDSDEFVEIWFVNRHGPPTILFTTCCVKPCATVLHV